MVIDKQKFRITCIIIGYFISLCSSQSTAKPRFIDRCSKWNISKRNIIFGQMNNSAGNDDYSLNLLNSSLGINRETGEIAVLDDNNHRVLVFNQTNITTLFAILSDSSNLTNQSMIRYSPSAIAYDQSNSIYILDGWLKQIVEMKNPLRNGENATVMNSSIPSSNPSVFSGTGVGLTIDNTDGSIFISDYENHQIIRYNKSLFIGSIYAGNGNAGNASDQLNNPTSIVIDNNRTLFVNDFGNNRIQMFKFNSRNGTTLPTYINGCIGLSLYSPDILVMNTKTAVYLFNLTNNDTICAIGCDNSELNDTHNALIDNDGNLILTNSNQVLSYSIYQKCPEVTTQPTINTTASSIFSPVNHCPPGTFGASCSSSDSICNMSQPCLNSGVCIENNASSYGYTCECASGFNGTNCEDDQRPCQFFTCFQRGNCINITETIFECQCFPGYEGQRCETPINFCANVTCQNHGVCFQQILNYTCNCLLDFSGRLCEITSTSAVARQYAVRSFGFIAILMLAVLIGFFVIMDVLKYIFGIDPVQTDRDNLRKKQRKNFKKKTKTERPKVAYRFQYVN